jgi:hypothetical protein
MGARILSETYVLFQVEVVLNPNKMQCPCILEFIYLSFLLRVPAPFSQSNVRSFSRKRCEMNLCYKYQQLFLVSVY